MIIKCELATSNRLAPSHNPRKCFSTICMGKKVNQINGQEVVSFTIVPGKGKTGITYMVKGNIHQVLSKFIQNGKVTIGLKEPPHDLYISKADPGKLKRFLLILKLAFRGDSTAEVLSEIDPLKTLKHCDLERPKTEMKIESRVDYPMRKSFEKSLEKLIINGCALKRFDNRILDLGRLHTLDLSHNQLSYLPDDICNLTALKQIYLNKNDFDHIPKCILNPKLFKSLKILEMCDNAIKFLPPKLSSCKELLTLKLDRNNIQCLPGDIGIMSSLQYLTLAHNELKFVPWSFQQLNLIEVDMSNNQFHVDLPIQTNMTIIPEVPSLFELMARFIVANRIEISPEELPNQIIQKLNSSKFCPCGRACVTQCAPYMTLLNLQKVSSTVIIASACEDGLRNTVRMIGYLCSQKCLKKWQNNPNALWK